MICNLKAAAKDPTLVTPIMASRCLNRFQIDLMDFSTTPDGKYNWIMQGKDLFSQYVLLEALEDKKASSTADIIKQWMGIIGKPWRL